MEPLICPQCGGQIADYSPGQTFATCSYCSTRFLIDQNKQKQTPPPEVFYEPDTAEGLNFNVIMGVMVALFVLIGGGLFIQFVAAKKNTGPVASKPAAPLSTPVKGSTPGATPVPELLEFGGKGTGNGLFKDANSIAVDSKGRIYVADDSMRVQQFDDKGQFLKVWQIPAKTGNYDHARTIDKIAVSDDGTLYLAVGGVIQVYKENSTKLFRVIEMAPDYIQDFALKTDGGMDIIYDNDRIETLIVVTKTGRITKQIAGFHTKALDAAISPRETAVAAIRLAVDGAGNIFSVYALGDLGSYSINSNNDELMIARFTPDGKYVNKFVQSMNSCGIEVDNQSRIYVSDGNNINIYKNNGDMVTTIGGSRNITAFALDKANNVYLLGEDMVVKKQAIDTPQ